jgi:hypothetical protein
MQRSHWYALDEICNLLPFGRICNCTNDDLQALSGPAAQRFDQEADADASRAADFAE